MPNYNFMDLPSTLRSGYKSIGQGSQLETVHRLLIEQAAASFDGSQKCKKEIVHAFNCITYMFLKTNLYLSTTFDDPLHQYTDYDDYTLESELGQKWFIFPRNVDWSQVARVEASSEYEPSSSKKPKNTVSKSSVAVQEDQVPIVTQAGMCSPTDKSDLYIQSPTVPQFDTSKPWKSGYVNGVTYTIYPSLPKIPTKQNEISVTTDVNIIGDQSLRSLFPNVLIRTRAAAMYEPVDGIKLDPVLGLIIPIDEFTEDQVRDNIVKYPHLFKLMKLVDGQLKSFYNTVEIDGNLEKIADVWDSLPESKVIPYTKDFVKEYVVRRYLLERDIEGVHHRYSMYGTLEPFLTLFAPIDNYINLGYRDILEIARSCVRSRVSYKQSRNPVLRRLSDE